MKALIFLLSCSAFAVDVQQIEKDLKSKGIEGYIHGAVPEQGLYVFTYRNPKNYFDYINMSLLTESADITSKLISLNRHDKILIKGSFLDNPSPQKHIEVSSLDIISKYDSGYPSEPYDHEAKIPEDLNNLNEANFLVHAVSGEGHILVVEFKDAILPVFVKDNSLTKDLYRNDIVHLKFSIQSYPGNPSHLKLKENESDSVKVIQSIKELNGKSGTIEGNLILFPKSPDIKFNVFAVQENLSDGLSRQYTLINFDDPNVFTKIREKLQSAWDKYPGEYTNGRNKLVSKRLKVKASGIFNEVDPSQANPQILLKDLNSIEVLE